MRHITTIQEAVVADRIAALRSEGAALRAERERDRRIGRAAGRGDFDRPSRRVRLGRWLVAFGEAIAGSSRPASSTSRALAAQPDRNDDPCGDGRDRLVRAT